ncbi:MAG: acyl-CoA dehydrogenase family protein [Sandaracinaceae bacterium]|nr:acyl-CoA dehydrogenase family protein [Sandaracinaceae bacterium]
MTARLPPIWHAAALRPLAPLVLAAWEDGSLTPGELLDLRSALERSPGLSHEERTSVRAFLDPSAPPSPQALLALERAVRASLEAVPAEQRRTLEALTSALSEGGGDAAQATALHRALQPLEAHLNADLLPRMAGTPTAGRLVALPDAELQTLKERLDGPHAPTRDRMRAMLAGPEFRAREGLSHHEYREQVLTWVRSLTALQLYEKAYGALDPAQREIGEFVCGFETLACFDMSVVVKFGVQFGLFGGAVASLGSARHHALLRDIGSGRLLGCFAMTERGHGSNVRDLETTGTYDAATQEWVIHTPSISAGKEWIGNAALHAKTAVVFGQLETQGEGHGVHAWLVPIRDDQGQPMPGVRIEDCGEKMGLNGVDNGRLWFDHVRVPREALLDRFGQVAEDGTYSSEIPSASRRFFTMLGVLVGGRVSVAGGALAASKVGLAIAIQYAEQRRQFPNAEGEEKPLFEYLTHQRRLVPRLAAACAFSFAQNALVEEFERSQKDPHPSREVETLAAGLKSLGTWQAIETLQLCRECCGGQGYLSSNRIDALRTDTDVFTTFEGDNTVLMQLAAKDVLGRFARKLGESPVRTLAETFARGMSARVSELVRSTDEADLRSPEFHSEALQFREDALLSSLAKRVNRRVKSGMTTQEAFEACQDHALALARAHIERFIYDAFRKGAEGVPLLEAHCALYGLWRIESDLAWFLENGYLAPDKARAIRHQVNALVGELRTSALGVTQAFAIPASCLGPLGDAEYLRSSGLAAGGAG